MHNYRLILLIMLFIVIPNVKADIISVNSVGSNEFVVIPTDTVEGFFFGHPSSETGGGNLNVEPNEISYINQSGICKLYRSVDENTEKLQLELDRLGISYNKTSFTYDIQNCKKSALRSFWIFFFLLISLLIIFIYEKRKRIYMLLSELDFDFIKKFN